MSEILFLQRGNYRAVEDFERFLSGQLFQFTRTHKKGSKHNGKKLTKDEKILYALQGGLREYKIMGYAVPKDRVNEVLNGLNIGDGEVHPWQASVAVNSLRKMMGAEKIPKKKDRGTTNRIIPREGVAIYMIGIKEDSESTWKDEKTGEEFHQENI